jgi:drug/metabolite transporter (DMT)-like permease
VDALALGLVLLAAFTHASWNLLAKQAQDKLAFLWCALLVSSIVFLPLGLWLALSRPVSMLGWSIVVVTCVLETAYFWALSQAYRFGDLSLVYPVARGVGPLLVPLLGVIVLGERLAWLAVVGIALIVLGVVVSHLPSLSRSGLRTLAGALTQRGTRYALLTGVCIAAYSIVDKVGVSLVPPLLYAYCVHIGSALGLAAIVLGRNRSAIFTEWQRNRGNVAVVGILSPLTYVLVLSAMTFTPVSLVAPAREISVVIGALLGAVVLHESYGQERLLGSAFIAAGLVLLVAG